MNTRVSKGGSPCISGEFSPTFCTNQQHGLCAHCGAADAQRECGARCGTAYCDESCADTHWIEAQHYEFCGRAAGHGRGNLKKGALTRTAKAHHMSNPKFERWAEAQDKAHTGKVSAKTMKRVHLAETFSHMNHGGKK